MAGEPAGSDDEIRFGGSWHAPRPDRAEGETTAPWYRLLEEAFVQLTSDAAMRALYGDPDHGATLVQAWRTQQLLGSAPPVCLLVASAPRVSAEGIPTVVVLAPDDLVHRLCDVVALEARGTAQLFTFDGRTGHCVTIFGADPDAGGVTFHDPWPGDSLLAESQNVAGVKATRAGDLWHLTAPELAKVAVAAFVFAGQWAELTGRPGRPTLEELRASDFYSFFNVTESAADDADPTHVRVSLRPGGFAEHIDMWLTHNEHGRIGFAELALRESWVIGPPYGINPFAKDLAASWMATFAPAADRTDVEPIAAAIREAAMDAATQARMQDPAWVESIPGRAAAAYFGVLEPGFGASFELSFLSISTETRDGEPWTTLRFALG